MTTKRCRSCQEEKSILEFRNDRRNTDGKVSYCYACYASFTRKDSKKWRGETTLGQRKAHYRSSNLKYLYGITPEDYSKMQTAQNNCCAICSGPPVGRRGVLFVDHDHGTNKIRGLLCHNCNCLIGLAKDSSVILKSAIHYLSKG